LNDDVVTIVISFLDENEIIFFQEACKLFYDVTRKMRKKTKFPTIEVIFSRVSTLVWAEKHDFIVNTIHMFKHVILFGNR
jgi:hypothetical protein